MTEDRRIWSVKENTSPFSQGLFLLSIKGFLDKEVEFAGLNLPQSACPTFPSLFPETKQRTEGRWLTPG